MKKLLPSFLSCLLLISPFILANPPSTNANVEKQIDAQH